VKGGLYKREDMPRQPGLDAPGTLHHVMGRGSKRPTSLGKMRIGRISYPDHQNPQDY
jgi:hypothetical protein